MKNMRHSCDVMEPLQALDDRGQEGGEVVYVPGVICSIEPIDATENEIAHQMQATRTYTVKFYGDPAKPITHRHWLRYLGRRLEIGSAIDVKMNGTEWELICGETVA
jgi:head-tail adaptor